MNHEELLAKSKGLAAGVVSVPALEPLAPLTYWQQRAMLCSLGVKEKATLLMTSNQLKASSAEHFSGLKNRSLRICVRGDSLPKCQIFPSVESLQEQLHQTAFNHAEEVLVRTVGCAEVIDIIRDFLMGKSRKSMVPVEAVGRVTLSI